MDTVIHRRLQPITRIASRVRTFSTGTRVMVILLSGLLAISAACSTSRLKNNPVTRWPAGGSYPTALQYRNGRSDQVLLMLAFSGGGTRAAAFAYGILEELRDTRIVIGHRERRLLDEIDILSGVSGGSFPAVYYGLYGDWIFHDFEERFLKTDVQDTILTRLFDPGNWPRLLSPYYGHWEVASEYFDENLFHGATFGDLARTRGPIVIVNATEIATGSRFTFTDAYFGLICSDLTNFPIAVAVTASSAVPVLFSPITLQNYAGRCDYPSAPWLQDALKASDIPLRRREFVQEDSSFLDVRRHPYLHLLDGGISDNLGIREVYDRVVRYGPNLARALNEIAHDNVRDIVLIAVNSQTEPEYNKTMADLNPGIADILEAVTSVQIDRYNFETLDLVRESFETWTRELSAPDKPMRFHLIPISFDDVRDNEERQFLHNLPTSFELQPDEVDRLRSSARHLLRLSPGFKAFLAQRDDKGAEAAPKKLSGFCSDPSVRSCGAGTSAHPQSAGGGASTPHSAR